MDEAYDAINVAEAFLGAALQVFLLVIRQDVPAFYKILEDVLDLAQMLLRFFPVHSSSIKARRANWRGFLCCSLFA
jgi:hypothetical protein